MRLAKLTAQAHKIPAPVRSRKVVGSKENGVAVIHSRQHFFAVPQLLPPIAGSARSGWASTHLLNSPPSLPLLDEPRKSYSAEEAYEFCRRLARTRYENVPVASRLLPAGMRPHVLAIYAFSRVADDFADEPEYAGKRHFALDQWEHELFRTFHGEADHPIFVALRSTVESHDLPITPFAELLTGFRMDLLAAPYATFDELRTYCRYTSEPMGQIILRLFGYRDPALQSYSNDFCTALQLVTFLQDLGTDVDRGRIYIPGEDLRHFGITEDELSALRHGGRHLQRLPRSWRDLLRFQSARARALMERGRPLLDAVGADLGLELELTYHSGQAMLDKIDTLGEGLLRTRPTLGRGDRARVLAKSVGKRWPQWPSWLARRGELGDL